MYQITAKSFSKENKNRTFYKKNESNTFTTFLIPQPPIEKWNQYAPLYKQGTYLRLESLVTRITVYVLVVLIITYLKYRKYIIFESFPKYKETLWNVMCNDLQLRVNKTRLPWLLFTLLSGTSIKKCMGFTSLNKKKCMRSSNSQHSENF